MDMMHQFGELRQKLSDREREEEALRQRAITAQEQPQDGQDEEHVMSGEIKICEQSVGEVSTQATAASVAAVLLQEEAPLPQQQHELTTEVVEKPEASVASGGSVTEEMLPRQASLKSQAGGEES